MHFYKITANCEEGKKLVVRYPELPPSRIYSPVKNFVMKRNRFFSLLAGVMLLFTCTNACQKKAEDAPPECRTCKAFGVDGVNQKQVCSDQEEQAFRNENRGKEISCQ